jgi:hypothetical protein
MELESRELTTCRVAADGQSVSLGFVDRGGECASVNFPIEQIGALAMTLPALMEKALRTRYQDDSLRYAFPLGSWTCEPASDPATSIVTLRTPDGFSVCFSLPRHQLNEIGEAMAAQPCEIAVPMSN